MADFFLGTPCRHRQRATLQVWMCGGRVLWVPCSRVGHVYRAFMPYNTGRFSREIKGDLITRNLKRVVEVWLDDKHKQYFYTRQPAAKYLSTLIRKSLL